MGELIAALFPEMLGLIVTPAAIAGCVLLLQSRRAVANAAAFAAAFLVVYGQVAVTALLGGAAQSNSTAETVSHWAGLVVGVMFLVAGAWVWVRRPAADTAPPKFLTELEAAGPRKAFSAGLVLAIVNPNLFIMMSGMSVIASSPTTTASALVGTALLLLAAALDFLIPIGLYLALGDRARTGLDRAKEWMLRNNRRLSIGVLIGFGALFTIRGVLNLTG
ncbi:GAP family protein [Nocardia sp. NPDC051833]|uniref:GAP family protein n=1 Tax=Nocardia sp. NPDC051833 TaxID=3155674 RepID=UPI00342726EB